MSHTTTVKSVPIKNLLALNKAIQKLQEEGIKCQLLENVAPRLYYKDQMVRQKKRKNEICDLVLSLPECIYDVAFLKKEDGSYEIIFDDYVNQYASGYKYKGINQVLGKPWKKAKTHWAGDRADTDETLTSIGKLLGAYSEMAVREEATAQGYAISDYSMEEDGTVNMVYEIIQY